MRRSSWLKNDRSVWKVAGLPSARRSRQRGRLAPTDRSHPRLKPYPPDREADAPGKEHGDGGHRVVLDGDDGVERWIVVGDEVQDALRGLTKECPGATTSNCGWDSFACAEFDLTGGGETLVFTDRSQSTPVKNESTSTIKLLITRY